MKRHFTHIMPVLPVLLTVTLLSCAKQEYAEKDTEIRFVTAGLDNEFDVTTKATAIVTDDLTEFYVAATSGSAGSESSEWTACRFSGIPGEAFRADEPRKWWPHDNPGYKFYGSTLPIVFNAGGSYVEADNSTDVVCAYLPNPAYLDLNTLTFNHIFARLGAFTVSAAEGYTISSATITLTPKVSGVYNLRTGSGQTDGTGWSSTSNGSAVNVIGSFSTVVYGTQSASSTSANDIYLVPGTYTLTASWTATRGDYTETFSSVEVSVALTAGKVNVLSSTLGGLAEEVVFTVSVTPWESRNTVALFPGQEEPSAPSFGGLYLSPEPLFCSQSESPGSFSFLGTEPLEWINYCVPQTFMSNDMENDWGWIEFYPTPEDREAYNYTSLYLRDFYFDCSQLASCSEVIDEGGHAWRLPSYEDLFTILDPSSDREGSTLTYQTFDYGLDEYRTVTYENLKIARVMFGDENGFGFLVFPDGLDITIDDDFGDNDWWFSDETGSTPLLMLANVDDVETYNQGFVELIEDYGCIYINSTGLFDSTGSPSLLGNDKYNIILSTSDDPDDVHNTVWPYVLFNKYAEYGPPTETKIMTYLVRTAE